MKDLSDFFDTYELFDDDLEIMVCALKELGLARERPSILKRWCEILNVKKMSKYTDRILSMKMESIKAWRRSKCKRQMTIEDYL